MSETSALKIFTVANQQFTLLYSPTDAVPVSLVTYPVLTYLHADDRIDEEQKTNKHANVR